MHNFQSFFLLTGATGLVGRYLLRDLLLGGHRVAVLCRSRGPVSGRNRIEAILQDWETRLGRRLLRPRVIEGDIRHPGLGIEESAESRSILEQVTAVVHGAASLRFEEDELGEEPLRSNLTGTQNVLALAQAWKIPHFHHVSTAYVSGDRSGRIMESELDCGQAFHNVYEHSKFQAEQLVERAAGFLSKTIYRPSIIVGDRVTGFSSTFHTIYSFVRFARALPECNAGNLDWIFDRLKLTGEEGKNLVPIDWVSAAMARLLERPSAWGTTYHLTNRRPISVRRLSDAIAEAVALEQTHWDAMALPASLADAQTAYQLHVDAYRGYMTDDPVFDNSRLEHALPGIDSPEIEHTSLVRMLAFAIRHRFRDPTPVLPRVADDETMRASIERACQDYSTTTENQDVWCLRISGVGGGVWMFGSNSLEAESSDIPWCHTTHETWRRLAGREIELSQAVKEGELLAVGPSSGRQRMLEALTQVIAEIDEPKVLPLRPKQGGRRLA